VQLNYERSLFRFLDRDRGFLAIDLGVRWDFMDWRFTTRTIAPTSQHTESGEDFLTQSMPVPVLGLSARFPVSESMDVYVYARGFRASQWNSLRKEGGTVYFSENIVDAGAGLSIRATERLTVSFGYRFFWIDQDEQSHEDGNTIRLLTHGLAVDLVAAF